MTRRFCDLCGREAAAAECLSSKDGRPVFHSIHFSSTMEGEELDLCKHCAKKLLLAEIPEEDSWDQGEGDE